MKEPEGQAMGSMAQGSWGWIEGLCRVQSAMFSAMLSDMFSAMFSLVFCVLRHVRWLLIDHPHLKAPKSQRSCRGRTRKPGPNHHHFFKGGLPVLC